MPGLEPEDDPRVHASTRRAVFDSAGSHLLTFGGPGTGNGQFNSPRGVAFDPTSGNIVAADGDNHRIQAFAPVVLDADGDGIADDLDNCRDDANADQADIDLDDLGDACDPDIDGDGALNDDDNCPFDSNADQADADGDGIGDACTADDDGDGVVDRADLCVPTATGKVVNAEGCSIADLAPCDSPWKNHGAYVSAVARTAEEFLDLGLITGAEKDAIVAAAGESQCGTKN